MEITDEKLQELINEQRSNGGFISFDGDNCEDCVGWDMESRRCECGNRRVDWEVDGSDGEYYIFAVAY